jgi:hypothetical protein
VPEEDNAEEDKPTEEANPEANPNGSAEGDPVQAVGEADFWSFPGDTVIRHHVNPRTTLFVPSDEDCPIPVKYIDVMRRTYTDLDTMAENTIDDLWTEDGARALSNPWKGKTVFHILRPPAPPGYRWVESRLTKLQQTTRPDSIWPEVWQSLSKKQKQVEIAKWELDRVKRDEARTKRGIIEVPADGEDCLKILSESRARFSQPKAPAMPVLEVDGSSTSIPGGLQSQPRPHQEHMSSKGHVSEEWYSFVHTPVPIPKAFKIPEAKAALEKEWSKLENRRAWDASKVKSRAEVIARAKSLGRPVHFGSLMDLCHVENSQLGKEFWTYKGRVVFRGDIVKDEYGQYAAFTEQGASASHMAAAEFMDAIARMPDNDGEDSDAVGAYTQVKLADAAKLLGMPDVITETWITLPPHRRPQSWNGIQDPVCPLLLNLYGHPLAGLLWEKYQESIIMKLGFENVQSWECLYVHREKQVFLSAYADDYKNGREKEEHFSNAGCFKG